MHITDRFHDSKWGVLTHYLSFVQNKAGDLHNQGVGETPWDECVDNVDGRDRLDGRELSFLHDGARYPLHHRA